MSNEWIIDVLGDLRGFATANAMPTLAKQLDESIMVAATEIAQAPVMGLTRSNGTQARRFAGAAR